MKDSCQHILRTIVEKHGAAICDDSVRIRGLLQDYLGGASGKPKQAIHVLVVALEAGVPKDLLGRQQCEPIESLMRRLAARLQDSTAMTDDAAHWSVATWAFALGLVQTQPSSLPAGENVRSASPKPSSLTGRPATEDEKPRAAGRSPATPTVGNAGNRQPEQNAVPVAVANIQPADKKHRRLSSVGGLAIVASLLVAIPGVWFVAKSLHAPPRTTFADLAAVLDSKGDARGGSGAAPARAIAPFDAITAQQLQDKWARYLGLSPETVNTIDMHLMLIPPGEFMMGSRESAEELAGVFQEFMSDNLVVKDEYPRHRVRIARPFYLGAREVTVGQFRRFVEDAGYKTEAETAAEGGMGMVWTNGRQSSGWKREFSWRNPGFAQTDDHPVVNVTRKDAIAFCQWLSRKEGRTYRLPTEAEWEYACRAGTTTLYCGGDYSNNIHEYAWLRLYKPQVEADTVAEPSPSNSESSEGAARQIGTHAVGQKHPNAWGVFDMHGNVREWCSDNYDADYYRVSPETDPPGPAANASHGVLRGGAWDLNPCQARSAHRCSAPVNISYYDAGFRVFCDAVTSSRNPLP